MIELAAFLVIVYLLFAMWPLVLIALGIALILVVIGLAIAFPLPALGVAAFVAIIYYAMEELNV